MQQFDVHFVSLITISKIWNYCQIVCIAHTLFM